MRIRLLVGIVALVGTSLVCRNGFGQVHYLVQDVGTVGGNLVSPLGVNNNGVVAAIGNTAPNFGGVFHLYTYSAGVKTDLGTLGGIGFMGSGGINDAGQIALTLRTNNAMGDPYSF